MDFFINLLDETPTAFHYIALARKLLSESGFVELKEEDEFKEIPDKFFVCRDEQTILAFNILDTKCGKFLATSLDYPTLKIQPNSGRFHNHCEQVNSFLYGKGMWITWPDRDLTLAGRVFIRDNNDNSQVVQKLIYPKIPVAEIPMLAVHLKSGSGVKTELEIENLQPVLKFIEEDDDDVNELKQSPALMKIISNECGCNVDDIINFDLSFISAEDQKIIGINDEILASQRISSILTSIIALKEYINQYGGDSKPYRGFTCFYAYSNDQESCPSRTGPNSNFLESILKRIGVEFSNNKDNFFSSSNFYGIKNTNGNLNHGGIRTFSDQQGNYQFSYEFSETTLNTLEKNKINVTRINSSNLSTDGAAAIGKRFNFPTFVFGIPIAGLFSIRETVFLNDLKAFREVIEILLK